MSSCPTYSDAILQNQKMLRSYKKVTIILKSIVKVPKSIGPKAQSLQLFQINEFGRKIFIVVVLNMFVHLSTVKVYYFYQYN
jgi:hypothetical protein